MYYTFENTTEYITMNYLTRTSFCTALTFLGLLTASGAQNFSQQYTAVQGIDYCTAAIHVEDTEGFEAGMAVILIQMNGAQIQDGNNSAFGTVTDLRNAGLYEKGQIDRISNDTVYLTATLVQEYNFDAAVQLVAMPTLATASIDETVSIAPWNGSTGGVLALKVTGTLTINGTLDARGAGFRGGALTDYDVECTGGFNNANRYFYAAGDWRGAGKGEGVAAFIPGRENGRGPQANGGGGGNDHNSGGGGGANVTQGGNGGRRETPFLDLGLSCKGDNPGIGGRALDNMAGRIFLGGGGGAGHTNNSESSRGGNGGGIVIIEAEVIVSNNGRIDVSGEAGEEGQGDGAGAGGAGGTVIVMATELQGQLTIDAKGGDGGGANGGNVEECYGPGGGGSGGVFFTNLTSNSLNVELAGGTAGILTNSLNDCNNTTSGAQAGAAGINSMLDVLPQGTEDPAPPVVTDQPTLVEACVEEDATIFITHSGVGVSYQWQIDRGNGFEDLIDNITYSGVNTNQLMITNVSNNMENDRYRLVLISECFGETISEPVALEVNLPPEEMVTEVINERTVIFTNSTRNASSFLWEFGDGNTSTATNPTHTYAEDGMYTVTLNIRSNCGEIVVQIPITIISTPEAAFTLDQPNGCAPLTVQFTNESSASATELEWSFPGGTPATSTEENPVVTYSEGGSYSVSLTATNEIGTETIQEENIIVVDPLPTPDFSAEVDNETFTATFTNTSTEANSYSWEFGDGNTSTAENPTHTFAIDGSYAVTLTATNDCGSTTITQNITVGEAPTPLFTAENTSGCAPLIVNFLDRSTGAIENMVWSFPGGTPETSTESNPTVRYETAGTFPVSLTVGNTIDDITKTLEGYVQVFPKPVAMFDYEVEAGTVAFINLSQGAERYNWNFGDGSTSMEENPVHEYAGNGFYNVTLNAFNAFCGTSFTQSVLLMVTDVETIGNAPELSIFPNPVADRLQIVVKGSSLKNAQVRLFSPEGKAVHHAIMTAEQMTLEVANLPAGLYLLQVIGEDWQVLKRVAKQ